MERGPVKQALLVKQAQLVPLVWVCAAGTVGMTAPTPALCGPKHPFLNSKRLFLDVQHKVPVEDPAQHHLALEQVFETCCAPHPEEHQEVEAVVAAVLPTAGQDSVFQNPCQQQ